MAKATKSVALFQQDSNAALPAHLQQDAGLGNENVKTEDMAVPRLDLVQQLSPQLDPNSPKYIEGAKLGHIFDSLAGDVYDFAWVINLQFETKFQVFKKRKFGGGFEGSFDNEAEARAHLAQVGLPEDQFDVVETGIHKCLMLDDQGTPKQPVLIYMSGSKQKISKAWNSAIALKDPRAARFASVWSLASAPEKNRQGQPYQNFKVDFAGWASEELYNEAKKIYASLAGGKSFDQASKSDDS